jgi:CheY-like chemotaxis protein
VQEAEDEMRLRAAALKNVESIQIARQRAERELLEAKEALERRTKELEQQREWFEVTLASIGDAVITTDVQRPLGAFNTLLPEVAVLDIGMPELDGYEVARQVRLRSLGRAVTLIAVTGWGQEADKARALAAGFDHHFTKPIDPEHIGQLLRIDPRIG